MITAEQATGSTSREKCSKNSRSFDLINWHKQQSFWSAC